MGSGHFLAAVVDHIADRALEYMAEADEKERPSPLTAEIESARVRIVRNAKGGKLNCPNIWTTACWFGARLEAGGLRRGQKSVGGGVGEVVAVAAHFHGGRAAFIFGPPLADGGFAVRRMD